MVCINKKKLWLTVLVLLIAACCLVFVKSHGEGGQFISSAIDQIDEDAVSKIVNAASWNYQVKKEGITAEVQKELESRMNRDGIEYAGENIEVRDCIYRDFDESGTMDVMVLLSAKEWGNMDGSIMCLYMNEDPVYVKEISLSCFFVEINTGDIDHDGNTELVYAADTGGVGGAGSYSKGILKYKDHSFEAMELPGDYTEEERCYGDAGYHMEVAFAADEGSYRISCPSIGESRVIYAPNAIREDGTLLQEPKEGTVVGAEARGFFHLQVIEEDGKDYLMGEEYLYGEGGIVHGVATARFTFDWEEDKGWIVKEFDVIY